MFRVFFQFKHQFVLLMVHILENVPQSMRLCRFRHLTWVKWVWNSILIQFRQLWFQVLRKLEIHSVMSLSKGILLT